MPAHVDPDNLQPGTSVGVYNVVRRVGAGGFGTLYQVERDGKHYALKLSRERLGSLTPEKRKRFEDRTDREVAALKSLRHPNIVAIYAVDRWPELETRDPQPRRREFRRGRGHQPGADALARLETTGHDDELRVSGIG